MLLYLLSKEPDQRTRKDHQAIEDQLICLRYFDLLHHNTKPKLYQALLRVMAQNATLTTFEQGQLIWKNQEKQDKIIILYEGKVQEYKALDDDELEEKRKILIKQFKQPDIFLEKPGRRVSLQYQQNGTLSVTINDAPRLRRTQVCEIPQHIELKRMNSIRHNKHPQIPILYQQQLNTEINILLKEVKLKNELHFQYFLTQCICSVRQTQIFEEGSLLNFDLSLKKHCTIAFALTDCTIISMNLCDYQSVENQIKLQKQSKIYRQLEAGFVTESFESEIEMHQLIKILMTKIEKFIYNPHNCIYSKGQPASYIYVIISGECQLSDDSLALARINEGCLLGEESFGVDHYLYKCVSTSKCKLFGIKTQDISVLCQRYTWFREQLEKKKQIKYSWLLDRQQIQRARIVSNGNFQFHISLNKLTNSARQIKTHRPVKSLFDKNQQEELGLLPKKTFRNNYLVPKQQRFIHQSQPSLSKDTSTDIDIIPMLMGLDKQQCTQLKELIKKGKIKPFTGSQEQRKKTYTSQLKQSSLKIMNRIQQQIN